MCFVPAQGLLRRIFVQRCSCFHPCKTGILRLQQSTERTAENRGAVRYRKGRVHYGTSLQLQRRPQHAAREGAQAGTGRAARVWRQRSERDGDEPPQQVVRCHHQGHRGHPAPGNEHSRQLQGRFLSGRCHPAICHGPAKFHDHRQGRLPCHRQLLEPCRQGSRQVRRGEHRCFQQGQELHLHPGRERHQL